MGEREVTSDTTLVQTASNHNILKPNIELRNFSEEALDSILHFQIIRLERQVYLWVSCNTPLMGSLCTSIFTPFDSIPCVSYLIGGGGGDSFCASMARRLALKTKISVVLATNIPSNSPSLETFAERRMVQELRVLGIAPPPPLLLPLPSPPPPPSPSHLHQVNVYRKEESSL